MPRSVAQAADRRALPYSLGVVAMIRVLLRVVSQGASIVLVTIKRLLAQWGLALATLAGLTAAVAFIMSIPLYADAVYFRLLRELLLGETPPAEVTPLTFRFRYVGARDGPLEWEDTRSLDAYLEAPAVDALKLPGPSLPWRRLQPHALTRHFKTNIFQIHWANADPTLNPAMSWLSLAMVSDLERHVQLESGAFPGTLAPMDGVVDVLVSAEAARKQGWQAGEVYLAYREDVRKDEQGLVLGTVPVSLMIRIAGTWTPVDRGATFWSTPLDELALVPEQTFVEHISPMMEDEIYLGQWELEADGHGLHASDVDPLLDRILAIAKEADLYLPSVAMDISPEEALVAYREGVPELSFQLFAFSIPTVALLLAFIGLVVGLYVAQQRGQIAILRSRGATEAQMAGIVTVEGLCLGALALVAGAATGGTIAWLMGQARSFLDFSAPPDLRVGLMPAAWASGLAALALAFVALLLPTLEAARHTIITYKQERARLLRPPWWQRIWLDVLLLLPTGYGFYLLEQQGSLAAAGGTDVTDIFQNPLLFLTPALGLFALTLFLARILPIVMSILAWISAQTRSVGVLLAARQLARAPAMFTIPLVLLTLTLSLSTFTASLANTLDAHLSKQMYYLVGADLRLAERGIEVSGGGAGALDLPPSLQPSVADLSAVPLGARWLFRPLESHLTVSGVRAATRVGRYPAVAEGLGGTPLNASYIGVERMDFPEVAYWQEDLANESLGGLMNLLAPDPDGVLVSRDYLSATGLDVGEIVPLIINVPDAPTRMNVKIVGAIDLFPTWYPEDGPLFVGNLGYLHERIGYTVPYEVWLKTTPAADQRKVVATVRGLTVLLTDPYIDSSEVVDDGLNIMVTDWKSAPLEILDEQRRPQRQGLFGLLSVGFVASAALTVLGFLLYALFSFRRRFIEFGVLRAVGLSTKQMITQLAAELASLIVVGSVAGTGLGLWVSAWFIPYLQIGVEASSRYPPFAVIIAWPAISRIHLLFGGLFLTALVGLVVLLRRMKIFQAVKLGETA